ncbi:hypothetical protein Tco_0593932 [Tanacetum coccineum]
MAVWGCNGGVEGGVRRWQWGWWGGDDIMMMMMIRAAAAAVVGRMMERRVEARGGGDRIDPVMGSLLELGRKSPPEKFSGGGEWRRWWPAAVAGRN